MRHVIVIGAQSVDRRELAELLGHVGGLEVIARDAGADHLAMDAQAVATSVDALLAVSTLLSALATAWSARVGRQRTAAGDAEERATIVVRTDVDEVTIEIGPHGPRLDLVAKRLPEAAEDIVSVQLRR